MRLTVQLVYVGLAAMLVSYGIARAECLYEHALVRYTIIDGDATISYTVCHTNRSLSEPDRTTFISAGMTDETELSTVLVDTYPYTCFQFSQTHQSTSTAPCIPSIELNVGCTYSLPSAISNTCIDGIIYEYRRDHYVSYDAPTNGFSLIQPDSGDIPDYMIAVNGYAGLQGFNGDPIIDCSINATSTRVVSVQPFNSTTVNITICSKYTASIGSADLLLSDRFFGRLFYEHGSYESHRFDLNSIGQFECVSIIRVRDAYCLSGPFVHRSGAVLASQLVCDVGTLDVLVPIYEDESIDCVTTNALMIRGTYSYSTESTSVSAAMVVDAFDTESTTITTTQTTTDTTTESTSGTTTDTTTGSTTGTTTLVELVSAPGTNSATTTTTTTTSTISCNGLLLNNTCIRCNGVTIHSQDNHIECDDCPSSTGTDGSHQSCIAGLSTVMSANVGVFSGSPSYVENVRIELERIFPRGIGIGTLTPSPTSTSWFVFVIYNISADNEAKVSMFQSVESEVRTSSLVIDIVETNITSDALVLRAYFSDMPTSMTRDGIVIVILMSAIAFILVVHARTFLSTPDPKTE